MTLLFFIFSFAILNLGRGRKFFNLTDSTVVGRLISTFLMAMVVSFYSIVDLPQAAILFAWSWFSLMLWCTPGWNRYWSAAIGHEQIYSRGWGLGALTIRMSLIFPYLIGLMKITNDYSNWLYLLGAFTLALPYYLFGYWYPKNPIPLAEIGTGAILGSLTYSIL